MKPVAQKKLCRRLVLAETKQFFPVSPTICTVALDVPIIVAPANLDLPGLAPRHFCGHYWKNLSR